MIRIKRGAAFDFVGQLMNDGKPYPLQGAVLSADCRQAVYFEFVQHMTITVVDYSTSLVRLYAAGTDTKKWLSLPHLIDVRLVKPNGEPLISNTVMFDVLDTVTQGGA